MDLQEFERIEASFRQFHAYFAPAFGRQQWQERSRDYLRGLLVQAAERGNAENLSEVVTGASARVLQRFLTEAKWDDQAVTEALQAYLAPRLAAPDAVWILDGSDFPKQGPHSVGVARQYCGALGKRANCQAGIFLAYSSSRGRALVDKRLYLPQEWTDAPARCAAAGVPEAARAYARKTELALALLDRARRWGHLSAAWVTGDDAFGQAPALRDALTAGGWQYVLEVPGYFTVWPAAPAFVQPPYRGRGRRPQLRPVATQRQAIQARRAALPQEAWQEITVAEGAQGPRTYRFAVERVREHRDDQPGPPCWLIHKENLDGTEPRSFFSNAPPDTPLAVLARVAMARWPIETEFEEEKSLVALDEYEVRSWAGWYHHVTMAMLAAAFLLTLQQDWKKKDAADYPAPGVSHRVRTLAQEALDPRRAPRLVTGHADPERAGEALTRPPTSPAALWGVQSRQSLSLKPSL